jgi:hypothetical protein
MLDLVRASTLVDPNRGNHNASTTAAVDPLGVGRIVHGGGGHGALLLGALEAAGRGHSSCATLVGATEGARRMTTPARTGAITRRETDATSWEIEKRI